MKRIRQPRGWTVALLAAMVAALSTVTAVQAQAPDETVSSVGNELRLAEDGTSTNPAAGDETARELDPDFDPDDDKPKDEDEKDDKPRDKPRDDRIKPPRVTTNVTSKAFFKSDKVPKFSFKLDPSQRNYFSDHEVIAKIDLEHKRDGNEVQRWKKPVIDREVYGVRWDGMKKNDKLSNPGKYRFKLTLIVDGHPTRGAGVRKRDGNVSAIRAFSFYTHRFPLPAKHEYGDGFGAGRGHQGQDIFAKCGKPVVAARGGTIQANQFQKAAGFYVTIDGAQTGVDYFYAHLKKRSKLDVGDHVKTGEQIGLNGETGNASGCHVHFELWTAPGWFEGGEAYPPTKQLKGWDRFS